MSDSIQCYATLHKQVRDSEDEVTVTFKCPASEFHKIIAIPSQKLLILSISIVPDISVNQGETQGE